MKRVSHARPKASSRGGLRKEYRFDYSKAQSNRFADGVKPGAIAVLLDADVARVFNSAESVNAVLRALVDTMPDRRGSTKAT
jgi:hypothetical protein